jgi:hypothetical protein
MTKGHGPVQLCWDNPNRERHTAHPNDPLDGRRGPKAPSTGSSPCRGKGTRTTPTLDGMVMQGWQPCDGGVSHHDAHSGNRVGR